MTTMPHWRRVERAMEVWQQKHGDAPLPFCACGCGESVGMGQYGPYKYIYGHNHRGMSEHRSEKMKARWQRAYETDEYIDIEKFRAAVHKVRKQRGWRVKDMAERAGYPLGTLTYLLYAKNRKCIERKTAEDFLARLAGKPMPPTEHQKKQWKKLKRSETELQRSLERE